MGLQTATILDGATCSATGGTSKSYQPDGLPVTRGVHCIDTSVTDFKVRPQFSAQVKQPVLASDGITWSKGRKTVTFQIPKVLASGKQIFPLVRIEFEDHPDMSDAEKTRILNIAGQILFDADFTNFWLLGSLG